jgi:hypothetical protein
VDTLVRLVNEDLERTRHWSVDRLGEKAWELGLYIDNRLSWREQVSRVVSRTYSTLRLLYRLLVI